MGTVDRGMEAHDTDEARVEALPWSDADLADECAGVTEELFAAVEAAAIARDEANVGLAAAEHAVHDARVALDRVLAQRAQADETIAVALRRADALESAGASEGDLRRRGEVLRGELAHLIEHVQGGRAGGAHIDVGGARQLLDAERAALDAVAERVRADVDRGTRALAMQEALVAYRAGRGDERDSVARALAAEWDDIVGADRAALEPVRDSDIETAQRSVTEAQRGLADVEAVLRARPESEWAIDAASDQLELWAAQRAVEQAQHDLDRLRARCDRAPEVLALRDRVVEHLGYPPTGDVGDVLRRHRAVAPSTRDQLLDVLRAVGVPLDRPLDECAEAWLGAQRRDTSDQRAQLAAVEARRGALDALGAQVDRLADDLARVDAALEERAALAAGDDPVLLAGEIRAQAGAVAGSVGAAHEERIAALVAAEAVLDEARRVAAGARTALERALGPRIARSEVKAMAAPTENHTTARHEDAR